MRTLADLYQEYIVDLDPILWEMGRVNGIWVDNEARLKLLDHLNGERDRLVLESQEMVPLDLKPRKHYVNEPDQETLEKLHFQGLETVEVRKPVKTCTNCGAQGVTASGHTARKGGRNGEAANLCYHAPIELRDGVETQFDVILPFNAGSNDQLRAYAGRYRHPLARDWKSGEDQLDKRQVQKLINKYGDKHPIYALALELGGVKKARGYANAWVPDQYGKVYGQFKNVPETLRLSQADHNFMNVSHRGDVPYAEDLRHLLIAKPGYVLLEADSSSIEAVFSGYLMGSPRYMEMARKGIHALWGLQSLGMEGTAENIIWLKNSDELAHKLLYERKKRTVHGVSYGMGAKLLFENYRKFFPSVAASQEEIDDFYRFAPELKAWHEETEKTAYKQGYLESPWGFRNYYYQVYTYDTITKTYKKGPDAKAAIAFQPQHANAMFQRENLKMIHAQIGKRGKRGVWFQTAIGHVHDSNGLAIPEDDILEAKEMMTEIMTRPIKQMGNITIGVEVKVGKNWGEMKRV